MARIYRSPLSPFGKVENLSISEFMTQYNPEGVSDDKVVHTDDINGAEITYGGLRRDAARVAWGLRHKVGLREGDTIVALLPNSNDFLLLAHGTWWAGGIFAPMNPLASQSDIEHIMLLLRPSHVVVDVSRVDLASRAIEFTKSEGIEIITAFGRSESLLQFPQDVVGSSDFESLPPFKLGDRDGSAVPSTICLSSGTTNKMKGVELSHSCLIANVLQSRAAVPSRQKSAVKEVWFTPYCHIYGLFAVSLAGMWLGGYYHGLREFKLESFCKKAHEVQVTDMHIVPPVALLLVTSQESLEFDLSHVERVVVGAAPLKGELQAKLKQRFARASVCQAYGMTECSPTVAIQLETEQDQVGSVGKLVPGTELRIVSPSTGKDVEPGQEGELWVRGPQVMIGYLNDEVATSESFCNGWLKTGDIGKMVNNSLWITDRLKEMIKYKGFQIAPSELEDLLLQHPVVVDAAVCAVYSDVDATEIPLAYVSLSPDHVNGSDASIQALLNSIRTWADGKVAGYKKLRGGVFHLQELPKNPTGKILRRMLPAKLKEVRSQRI